MCLTDKEHSERVRKATQKGAEQQQMQNLHEALEHSGYSAAAVGAERAS
jgi:hypothetical protein